MRIISGKLKDLDQMIIELKRLNIKNIKLPVSAPFHCILMNPATKIMEKEILQYLVVVSEQRLEVDIGH